MELVLLVLTGEELKHIVDACIQMIDETEIQKIRSGEKSVIENDDNPL
jgi:hypothetical protein